MKHNRPDLWKLILLCVIVGVILGYSLGQALAHSILFITGHIHLG